jgi:hypothetical protein
MIVMIWPRHVILMLPMLNCMPNVAFCIQANHRTFSESLDKNEMPVLHNARKNFPLQDHIMSILLICTALSFFTGACPN